MKNYYYLLIFQLILILSFDSFCTEKKRYHYIFENSYEINVKLGKVAKTLHYALEIGSQIPKGYLAYKATGDPFSTTAFMAYEFAKTPPIITGQSLADLKLRYYLKKKEALKSLAKIPHIKSIKVFSTSKTKYSYVLAEQQTNKGLIFIETDHPISSHDLPDNIKKLNLGKIVEMPDLEKTNIELFLEIDGKRKGVSWSPSLKEIFEDQPFPVEVTNKWREEFEGALKRQRKIDQVAKGKFLEFFSHLTDGYENVKIKAILRSSDGKVIPLGVIAGGKPALKLIKKSLWSKVKRIFNKTKKESPKKFPITSTKVKKSKFSNCYIKAIQNLLPRKVYK